MFRNLLLAILIATVLTACVCTVAIQWQDLTIQIDQQWIEAMMTFLIICSVVAVVVVLGFAVAISVFGALIFALCAGLVGLFVAGVSVFWPFLLFVLIVYFLVRDKGSRPRQNHY